MADLLLILKNILISARRRSTHCNLCLPLDAVLRLELNCVRSPLIRQLFRGNNRTKLNFPLRIIKLKLWHRVLCSVGRYISILFCICLHLFYARQSVDIFSVMMSMTSVSWMLRYLLLRTCFHQTDMDTLTEAAVWPCAPPSSTKYHSPLAWRLSALTCCLVADPGEARWHWTT